jgi:hypothetical protein
MQVWLFFKSSRDYSNVLLALRAMGSKEFLRHLFHTHLFNLSSLAPFSNSLLFWLTPCYLLFTTTLEVSIIAPFCRWKKQDSKPSIWSGRARPGHNTHKGAPGLFLHHSFSLSGIRNPLLYRILPIKHTLDLFYIVLHQLPWTLSHTFVAEHSVFQVIFKN